MSSESYEQENFRCITDDLVSVQPVSLDLHVVVALADVIAPTPCSDTPPVQPVLKAWLPRAWHHLWNIVCPMHRCLSWCRRFNRCLTWSSLELQRRSDLHQTPGRRIFRQPSDAPMLRHRFFRCYWFLQNSSNSAFLWVLSSCFALHGLFTSSLGSRNVLLTKPLVPLIALSFDHQNHSKWHKWCHVRYRYTSD